MLLVFGTHGSPGASTLSILTAALWTSEGREVALIDGDPTGGTLASHLGLYQDPGVASLILSRTIDVETVISCSQRVLVDKLRVLPLPTSVAGSSASVERLSERGEELSQVATKLPLIVDAGRAYYGTPMASLVPHAKVVVFVINAAHLPALNSLSNYRQMLGIDVESLAGSEGPIASADRVTALLSDSFGIVTIGPPYFGQTEFEEQVGIPVIASTPYDPIKAYEFPETLLMQNRPAKHFMAGVSSVADLLWKMTYPKLTKSIFHHEDEEFVEDPFAVGFGDKGSDAPRQAASQADSDGAATKETASAAPRKFGVRQE